MKLSVLALAVVAALTVPVADARERGAWRWSKTTDPITGKSSCVVTASDRAGGLSFTRTGAIYPIVEMNGDHGLLVGVSSGGRVRLPTGDIVWRVDDLPHREIRSADGPAGPPSAVPEDAMARLTEEMMALTRAATATSTVASGDLAWEMLAEMRAGTGLQFRQVSAAAGYGLPQEGQRLTGQVTGKGLRPYPLDRSFHDGLLACGIGEPATVGPDQP